jgi:hypothetical protein
MLQIPVALCALTSGSQSSSSSCNFVDISLFTLQCPFLFSLFSITYFGLAGHHLVHETLDAVLTIC